MHVTAIKAKRRHTSEGVCKEGIRRVEGGKQGGNDEVKLETSWW